MRSAICLLVRVSGKPLLIGHQRQNDTYGQHQHGRPVGVLMQHVIQPIGHKKRPDELAVLEYEVAKWWANLTYPMKEEVADPNHH